MDTDTVCARHNEARNLASPQLAAADAFAGDGSDITLELADLSVGQLSAVAALMLSLDAAQARARSAEHQLAAQVSRCIYHAAVVAEEEACKASGFPADGYEVAAFKTAA
jgi:hypothetical protein